MAASVRAVVRPVALAILALVACAAPAQALMFQEQQLKAGQWILWVRDCGKQGFRDEKCSENERSFFRNDAARLQQVISRKYEEVWLVSLGGNLDEGVKVGEVLRAAQATVRVPAGYRCVSACTVAFLGGAFRTVDDGASYEVHAASGIHEGFDEFSQEEAVKQLSFNAEEGLAAFAESEQESARYWAARLVSYVERMLMPLGRNAPPTTADRLARWQQRRPPIPYLTSPQLKLDAERFRREGLPAAQETMMRIERDSMDAAIVEIRAMVGELGPRAAPAVDILEAMYSSRIVLTAALTKETLAKMGYTTTFIARPN
jgi:hypothetical protein